MRRLVADEGEPGGDGFVFVTDARNPIRRTAFGDVWRAAGD
jgi:hypothetical protein